MTSLTGMVAEQPRKCRLDPERIILTADKLAINVEQALPQTTLAGLAKDLAQIARETDQRVKHAARPIYTIRLLSLLAVAGGIAAPLYLLGHLSAKWEFETVTDLFEAADAGFNLILLLAGALWFLFTLESRIKRNRVLEFIGELREFTHVIDVTQLYYTPDLYASDGQDSPSRFDYTYLFFCTQMLGVITNLAALYTRSAPSDSIWRAASEVETLANAIATKLVSKTETVHLISTANRR
jgi:hypothetical protein